MSTDKKSLTVRLCQTQVEDGSTEEALNSNFSRIQRILGASKENIVIFPEGCTSGFPYSNLEQVSNLNERFLRTVAYRQTCILPLILKEGSHFYNRTVVLRDKTQLVTYDKIHLIGLLGEDRFLSPGTNVRRFSIGEFEIGLATCYDIRFPELFRKLTREGANLFILPSMWPIERETHLHALARARAIENQAYVIVVNAVGKTGSLNLCGGSVVFDPQGECILNLEKQISEGIVNLDLSELTDWRTRFPVLKDARL